MSLCKLDWQLEFDPVLQLLHHLEHCLVVVERPYDLDAHRHAPGVRHGLVSIVGEKIVDGVSERGLVKVNLGHRHYT